MRPTHSTFAILSLLTLSACAASEYPGSQIGSEEDLTCVTLSTETLSDLSAIPDGFSVSPQAALDQAVGTWSGAPLDDEEQPLSGNVSLTVAHSGSPVVLERFEAVVDGESPETGAIDSAVMCPPRMTTELAFTLVADGLPPFESTLETSIRDEAWAETNESAAFAGALPAPDFDADSFDEVESWVVFSGGVQSDWWTYVDWRAWNPSEAAPDGDVPTTTDLLLMARLSRE